MGINSGCQYPQIEGGYEQDDHSVWYRKVLHERLDACGLGLSEHHSVWYSNILRKRSHGEIPLALMFKLAKALLLQVCIDPTYKIALTLLFLCKLYQTLINFMKLYLVRPAKNNFLAKLAITLLFFWHDSPMPTRFVYVGLKSTQKVKFPLALLFFMTWFTYVNHIYACCLKVHRL